jgi:hypothetical protein
MMIEFQFVDKYTRDIKPYEWRDVFSDRATETGRQ